MDAAILVVVILVFAAYAAPQLRREAHARRHKARLMREQAEQAGAGPLPIGGADE